MVNEPGSPPADEGSCIHRLVLQARTLDELLEIGDASGGCAELPHPAAIAAMDRWCRLVAAGDREVFNRRLAWDDLDETRVTARLGRALDRNAEEVPHPLPSAWARLLAAALGRHEEQSNAPGEPTFTRLHERPIIPFPELLSPFVQVAREQVERTTPGWTTLLSSDARHDLERHLAAQLDDVAGGMLLTRSAAGKSVGGRALAGSSAAGPRVWTSVASMTAGECRDLLMEFPALARLLGILMADWCEVVDEFCARLRHDLPTLTRDLLQGIPPGEVVGIDPALSDRHRGGRQTWSVRFRSGSRLVYKPRDIRLEAAFNRVLSELRNLGLEPAPPAIAMLPGSGYGWVEFVPHSPTRDGAAARRYFRMAGALLCLTHVLRGTDLHMDNLVAGPGGPVLVDGETLLQPLPASTPSTVPAGHADDPCTAGGLVSVLQVGAAGSVHDVGGLAGRGGFPLETPVRRVVRSGTGTMMVAEVPVRARHGANALILHGAPCHPAEYRDDLVKGFADTWRFLRARYDRLAAPGGLVEAFLGCSTRLVVRPSHLYGWLLQRSLVPAYLRDGLSRSCFLDVINRLPSDRKDKPGLWSLTTEERRALEHLDIPHFQVPVAAGIMTTQAGTPTGEPFAATGYDAMLDRLARLNEADLGSQISVLDLCLATSWMAAAPTDGRFPLTKRTQAYGNHPGNSPARYEGAGEPSPFVARALTDLAQALAVSQAEVARGNHPSPATTSGEDPLLPWYLYDGRLGGSLFLAALAAVTGARDHHRHAWRLCADLAPDSDGRWPAGWTAAAPLGACHGLGGIIYGATVISQLLDDGRFLEIARCAAAAITPERIAADQRLDVEGGAAGAIFGLLAIAAVTGEREFLAQAEACGQHVLGAQEPAPGGGAAWRDTRGTLATGFAHGAAGMATALARLAGATGNPTLLAGARRAVAFEHSVAQESGGGWPATVPGPDGVAQAVALHAWCHGAPGIALGRATAGAGLGAEAAEDLANALQFTASAPLHETDHLCCGTFGVVDMLLTVGIALDREDLVRAAEARAALVIQRSWCLGSSGFRSADGHVNHPGFFRGVSGIGYELLRLVEPLRLPSIPAFQTPVAGRDLTPRAATSTPGQPGKEAP